MIYIIEVSVKISIEADEIPDDKATSIVDKIKTKIHCNRETMKLVGLITEVYEGCDDEED